MRIEIFDFRFNLDRYGIDYVMKFKIMRNTFHSYDYEGLGVVEITKKNLIIKDQVLMKIY